MLVNSFPNQEKELSRFLVIFLFIIKTPLNLGMEIFL